jgi:hypothetical protein
MTKVLRTMLILIAAWGAWLVIFFVIPGVTLGGLITAAVTFFAFPIMALKESKAWREAPRKATSVIPAALLGFERHVPLMDGGAGVTFRIVRRPSGPEFFWTFDDACGGPSLVLMSLAQEALTEIEKELGLPVSFPDSTARGRESAAGESAQPET